MWGYHDEGLWDTTAAINLEKVADEYPPIELVYSEGTDLAKVEGALRNLAATCDIIWTHSYSYEEFAMNVAEDFPEKIFWIEYNLDRGVDYYPHNCIQLGYDIGRDFFLSGALLGEVSQTGKIGIVTGFDEPLSNWWVNAFRDGILYANPSATVTRTVMEAFLDPVKSREAVKGFAQQGYDIVINMLDDESVTLEAQEQGIWSFNIYQDLTPKYPDTVVANFIFNQYMPLGQIVEAIRAGTYDEFRNTHWFTWISIEDGSGEVGSYGNMVTQAAKDYVEQVKAKLLSGEITVELKETW